MALDEPEANRYAGSAGVFDSVPASTNDSRGAPQRSVEGWIIFVRGIHAEAHQDDIGDLFRDFGELKNIQLPLDRRTGVVKGYALIEYESKSDAQRAIDKMNGHSFRGQALEVDWGFVSAGPRAARR